MSNSMKTLIFIISLFAYFLFFSLFMNVVRVLADAVPQGFAPHLINIAYSLCFLAVILTQALVRYIYADRHIKTAKVIYSAKALQLRVYDRLMLYFFPVLAAVAPIFQTKAFGSDNVRAIIYVIIIIIIIEILLYLNKKSVKVYVTDKGIGIKGFDIRFDMPIPMAYPNGTGFYAWVRLNDFLMFNDKIVLTRSYDMGTITIPASGEELRMLKGLLLKNGIPEKKFYQ